MNKFIDLFKADPYRMEVLRLIASFHLPDCYIAAGFVRNLVWDHLHNYSPTALNDIDVIYYAKDIIEERTFLSELEKAFPLAKWQIKNQAFMNTVNGHVPYTDSVHAMRFWPEEETAIGVMLDRKGDIKIVSPFDSNSIFDGFITHNKSCDLSIYQRRLATKRWLAIWPKLRSRN